MNNYYEEFQGLGLDELEGISGGLDPRRMNREEQKKFIALRKKYFKLKGKRGTDEYDPVAVSAAHAELMQYVADMEEIYGK